MLLLYEKLSRPVLFFAELGKAAYGVRESTNRSKRRTKRKVKKRRKNMKNERKIQKERET